MRFSAWLTAAAVLLMAGSLRPALAQPVPQPPADAWSTQAAPARPPASGSKSQTGGPKVQRPAQPAPQRAKPNTSYAYCRGVARYMGLRGAERRKTILDCQLGVMPKITKG